MTDEKITHITIDEIRAKVARGDARMTAAVIDMMTDEEIEAAMRDDPDWKDHIDEDWSAAQLVIPRDYLKQLRQRLLHDARVLEAGGGGFPTIVSELRETVTVISILTSALMGAKFDARVATLGHDQLNRFIRMFDASGFRGIHVEEQARQIVAENARLREALAPFAAEADEHDGASAIFTASVPIGWLRAARAAHKGGAA